MATEDAVLKFEIAEGLNPDVEVVAAALLAWSETVKTALRIIEPSEEPRIELIGVESGSDVFRIGIRKVLEASKRLDAASEEYPLIARMAGTLGAAIVGGVVGVAMQPDARIPADQFKVWEKMQQDLHASLELQQKRERFYSTMYPEPAIAAVEVQQGGTRETIYTVPRSEFAQGSGLWTVQADALPERRTETRLATWDVILIRPTAVAKPRRWTFARDGLPFSATMNDPAVLTAIANRTLPIQVAEGVHMKIELEYKEEFDGKVWIPLSETFKVRRVISPALPGSSIPLFPAPGVPKEPNQSDENGSGNGKR
jgi:hypothetical protein